MGGCNAESLVRAATKAKREGFERLCSEPSSQIAASGPVRRRRVCLGQKFCYGELNTRARHTVHAHAFSLCCTGQIVSIAASLALPPCTIVQREQMSGITFVSSCLML